MSASVWIGYAELAVFFVVLGACFLAGLTDKGDR